MENLLSENVVFWDAYTQRNRDELMLMHAIMVSSRLWQSSFANLIRMQDSDSRTSESCTSTLCYLASEPKGLTQSELCELVCISGPSMTRRLELLEARDLISRGPLIGDRRARLVKIRPAGLVVLESLITEASALGRLAFEGLDDQSVVKLKRTIDDIAARLGSAS